MPGSVTNYPKGWTREDEQGFLEWVAAQEARLPRCTCLVCQIEREEELAADPLLNQFT